MVTLVIRCEENEYVKVHQRRYHQPPPTSSSNVVDPKLSLSIASIVRETTKGRVEVKRCPEVNDVNLGMCTRMPPVAAAPFRCFIFGLSLSLALAVPIIRMT